MNNNKNKQILFGIIGILILVISVVGVTFAFFNYTRTGNGNIVQAGRIVFNSTEDNTINLENAFPITSTQAQTDTTNAKSLQVRVTGDTSYSKGIEYLITATDVHMTTTTGKTVPVTIEVNVTGNNSKTLGTSDDDYYTNRGGSTSIYKVEYDGELNNDDHILVGYIAPDTTETGVDGLINIKAYFNDADILISDTYNDGNEPTDAKGTPANLGEGKTVLTTSEWNSLTGSNALSFKIKVEAREGTWVEEVLSVNTMNTFPSVITDEKANIKEIYFNKMSSSAMQTAYSNATIKADLTYNNEGKVLAWLESDTIDNTKYIMYVASDGKTYFPRDSSNLFNSYSSLDKVEFNNIDTSNVTNMDGMFTHCINLKQISLSNFNTNNVISMNSMFYNCSSLTSLDLSNFDTSNVTIMPSMFGKCSSLTSLDLSGLNTSSVTNMNDMFSGCSGLISLDLTGLGSNNLNSISNMFSGCLNLQEINMNNFNFGNVSSIQSIFENLSALKRIHLNNIDASKIITLTTMFSGCTSLEEIDLSSFTISNSALIANMFMNCSSLKTIYVSELWNASNQPNGMPIFTGCTSLIGENGTTFDSTKVDKTMAVIDGTNGQPGYLTKR